MTIAQQIRHGRLGAYLRASRARGALAVLILTFSAGCAEQASLYHLRPLAPGQTSALTVDAMQRSTYFTHVDSRMRLCAEAAPDAFSAFSASASADVGLDGLGGPSTNAQARAALAISQAAGTIERTQTINLLRESMYRTCERYLSGALDRASFVVQAARDQRSMVTVLAIEQLTRAARGTSTILVGPGTNTSIENGEQLVRLVARLEEERAAAAEQARSAEEAYQAALPAGKCNTVTTAPAANAADPTLAQWTACKSAQAAAQQKAAAAAAATERLNDALTLTGTVTTSAGTGGGASSGGGGGTPLSGADLVAVAREIRQIATAPSIDEALMFCIAYLNPPTSSVDAARIDPAVRNTCLTVLRNRAADDIGVRAGMISALRRENDRGSNE